MIDGDKNELSDDIFVDSDTDDHVSYDRTPNFLNNFFAKISNRVCCDKLSK